MIWTRDINVQMVQNNKRSCKIQFWITYANVNFIKS
jgi:hypothetical protein